MSVQLPETFPDNGTIASQLQTSHHTDGIYAYLKNLKVIASLSEQFANKPKMKYPEIRTEVDSILSPLQKEMDPSSWAVYTEKISKAIAESNDVKVLQPMTEKSLQKRRSVCVIV